MRWEDFLAHSLDFIQTHRLMPPGAFVLAAVSGGVDSMMLLEALAALRVPLQLGGLCAIYVDHGLRPTQTPDEAATVREHAQRLGVESDVVSIQIEVTDGSLQDAARQARRAALEGWIKRRGFALIATGHHQDDQAETLLLRLLRGTSPDGVGGILPQAGTWVHPLLPFSRASLVALAQARGIKWHEDPTNQSTKYLRNLVRHQLLPVLEEAAGHTQVRPQLARLAGYVQDDAAYFREQIEALMGPPLIEQRGGVYVLSLTHWDELAPALRWRLLRQLLLVAYGQGFPLQHIEHLGQLAAIREGEKQASLPAPASVLRRYDELHFFPVGHRHEGAPFCLDISAPGRYICPTGVFELQALTEASAPPDAPPDDLPGWVCYLPASAEKEVLPGFCLRTRQPGDRVPLARGHRPLKKWMIDAKIPKSSRFLIPLVELSGLISWVIGWRCFPPLQRQKPPHGWLLRFVPQSEEADHTALIPPAAKNH